MKRSDLVLTLGQRLLLLLFTFIVCYGITVAAIAFLSRILADNVPAALRIGAILQDVITFIVPAIATALFATRRPAELLCLVSRPSFRTAVLIAAMLFVSVPIQENIIYWNYHITLPGALETFARQLEDAANATMTSLLADGSVMALIVNLLIIGIAAGFSEELLFRGCFQRLLTTGGVNRHIAVWTVAIVFSALHFQFYGFVPRLLLGAYFGYLLLWTDSLWAPVIAHVLNNSMFVIAAWHQTRTGLAISTEPTLYSLPLTLASAALTLLILCLLYKYRIKS